MTKKTGKPEPKKSEWIARIRCTVIKSVCLSNCTATDAWENPWRFSVDETDIDMPDWEVEKVEPNT